MYASFMFTNQMTFLLSNWINCSKQPSLLMPNYLDHGETARLLLHQRMLAASTITSH